MAQLDHFGQPGCAAGKLQSGRILGQDLRVSRRDRHNIALALHPRLVIGNRCEERSLKRSGQDSFQAGDLPGEGNNKQALQRRAF